MKKWICWMLAAMLSLGCACCFAEGTGAAEGTGFLQIKEGVTAQVFANPGDEAEIDRLASGRLCGVISESAEGGVLWYGVFYLNSEKKGATGYIKAEDADLLDAAALRALMENPDKLNEVLDLIDALNDYLKTGAVPDQENPKADGTGKQTARDALTKLYDEAMTALAGISGAEISGDIEKAAAAGREAAETAVAAGKESMESAAAEASDLLEKVRGAADEKLDGGSLDSLLEKVSDTVVALDDVFPAGTGDKIADLLDDIKESKEFADAQKTIDDAMTKISGTGLDTVQALLDIFTASGAGK